MLLKDIRFRSISKVIQKRLEASSVAFQVLEDADPVSQYKDMCKEVKVNLSEEYRHHLKCMELLESLKALQLGFDHSFFKNFVCQFIDREDLKAK